MFPVPLVTSSTKVPVDSFWSCIKLYHDRPNLVNRKLTGITQCIFCELKLDRTKIERPYEIFRREAVLYESRKLEDLTGVSVAFVESIVEGHDVTVVESHWNDLDRNHGSVFVSFRVLWPRLGKASVEVVVIDKQDKVVTFFTPQEPDAPLIAPPFPYHVELTSGGNLRIVLDSFDDADTSSAVWLTEKLFSSMLRWSERGVEDEGHIISLSMIEAGEYCRRYNELKGKYGLGLVKIWPEQTTTDPQKFIYEDIAIATYLICLWRKLQTTDVNFVDLGCGNGLLVYILNKEGYPGKGVDLRNRKIWDHFNDEATLEVETLTPDSCYPHATWLIGNHSDELTPWIPVMALKSSPRTNFFVLPCCPYDFNGQKYIRQNSKLSQYSDYLNYIEDISRKCGFDPLVDKLRIPSTKRTCLIGTRDNNNIDNIRNKVDEFINMRLGSGFKPRNSVEVVRNCTQLDRDLIKRVLDCVIRRLLSNENYTKNFRGQPWNKGGAFSLNDLIKVIPGQDLKLLKNNCGGLQTLLKNHRYLFEFANGNVSLREPLSLNEATRKYKNKPCWFEKNHPDGCLFVSESCAYKHEK